MALSCGNCGSNITKEQLKEYLRAAKTQRAVALRVMHRFNYLNNREEYLKKETQKNIEGMKKLFEIIEGIDDGKKE